MSAFGEEGGGLGGRGDGEGVDDPRSGEPVEVLGEPAEAVGVVGQAHHAQVQALAVEAAAQHEGGVLVAGLQLLGDVAGDPLVGGGGGGQHRDAGGQFVQQGADAPVVGTEVVPPVGDAVGLVDDHQSGAGRQFGQDAVAELGVVEAFGTDEEHVDLAGGHGGVGALPLLGVGAVDGVGADSGAFGRGDLVAHQGQQRGDDHGGPGSLGAAQRGGHEVDRGLAPAGALHHQHAPVLGGQGAHGAPLVLAQSRVRSGERAQVGLGGLAQGGVGVGECWCGHVLLPTRPRAVGLRTRRTAVEKRWGPMSIRITET